MRHRAVHRTEVRRIVEHGVRHVGRGGRDQHHVRAAILALYVRDAASEGGLVVRRGPVVSDECAVPLELSRPERRLELVFADHVVVRAPDAEVGPVRRRVEGVILRRDERRGGNPGPLGDVVDDPLRQCRIRVQHDVPVRGEAVLVSRNKTSREDVRPRDGCGGEERHEGANGAEAAQ